MNQLERNTHYQLHNEVVARRYGLALIEVIVGILLLASCVVGIAAIYAQQQHSLRGGRLHNVAAALSNDMVSMINYEHDKSVSFETGIGRVCDARKSATAKDNSIDNQIACWQDKIAHELPNGSSRIVLDTSAVPEQYVITISWTDRAGTASYVRRVTRNTNTSK